MRLEGQTAIVTGGGRGIGQAIALALAAEGCSVAVSGRNVANIERVACEVQKLGRESLAVACDISEPASIAGLFGKVQEKWGKLDILVNNAGEGTSPERLVRVSLDDWNRTLATNLTGTFLCSQHALRLMLPRKSGRIINIASIMSKIPLRGEGAYTSSKHGVLGLTRTLALETASSGITVNAICPGWVDTDIAKEAVERIVVRNKVTVEQARELIAADCPQKRIIQPEEIASATVWLACELSKGITGQAINIDGGWVMF